MSRGVMACECIKEPLGCLTWDDPDTENNKNLVFSLHLYSQSLKRTVIEMFNALEGKVDAAPLGYGPCNSLKEMTSDPGFQIVRLDADDCIVEQFHQGKIRRISV